MIHFRCDRCRARLRVSARHAGRITSCIRCDAGLVIPGAAPARTSFRSAPARPQLKVAARWSQALWAESAELPRPGVKVLQPDQLRALLVVLLGLLCLTGSGIWCLLPTGAPAVHREQAAAVAPQEPKMAAASATAPAVVLERLQAELLKEREQLVRERAQDGELRKGQVERIAQLEKLVREQERALADCVADLKKAGELLLARPGPSDLPVAPPPPPAWPPIGQVIAQGESIVRVVNPEPTPMMVGLRAAGGLGRDFLVPARGWWQVAVPAGMSYDLYYRAQAEPHVHFQAYPFVTNFGVLTRITLLKNNPGPRP